MKCMSAWNFIVHLVSWQCSALELLYYIYIYICHSVHSIQMYCSTGSRVHNKPVEWSTIHNNNSTLAARATYVSINLINIELHSFFPLFTNYLSAIWYPPPSHTQTHKPHFFPINKILHAGLFSAHVIFALHNFELLPCLIFTPNYCVSIKKHCKREKFAQC